ncbi:hypothetical protein MNBD_GAMMA12-2448 [hydrothermal vent metagenome]|uniref:Uncharacterized protein n=1 Tax=hydrothermal vent metagenome TaxID=652676 RepID=A0A3B0YDS7_9ZZZZ
MNEEEFKNVYKSVNKQKCAFEKAALTRRYSCSRLIRRNIGEREAAGCSESQACHLCNELLCKIREKSRFVLKTTGTGKNPLPHAKEVKVQCGGLSGLELLAGANHEDAGKDLIQTSCLNNELNTQLPSVQDIYQTIKMTLQKYSTLNQIPWPSVVQAVTQFSGRKKRGSRV